jgi:hypothetical protein
LQPVLIGDTHIPELEVTELVPKTKVGLLRLTARVKNQRGAIKDQDVSLGPWRQAEYGAGA